MKENKYILGLKNNDSSIIQQIYTDYAGRIQAHIVKNGGSIDDAKDVFHDALMIVYQKSQSTDFQLTSKFYTYLFGTCNFIWLRKKKKKSNNSVTIEKEEGLKSEEDIEAAILERERHNIFRENFLRMGTFCQQILELFFAQKDMTEIAGKMSLKNEHTARNRKYRCQKELEKLVHTDVRYKELF